MRRLPQGSLLFCKRTHGPNGSLINYIQKNTDRTDVSFHQYDYNHFWLLTSKIIKFHDIGFIFC